MQDFPNINKPLFSEKFIDYFLKKTVALLENRHYPKDYYLTGNGGSHKQGGGAYANCMDEYNLRASHDRNAKLGGTRS